MKVLCDEQRSAEWDEARKGCITASQAHIALMRKGTKGRQAYIERLADDLQDIPNFSEGEVSQFMMAGRAWEPFARGWYAYHCDVAVRETGFIVHDHYSWIGCSPDGLIDQDYRDQGPGGLEVKCRFFLRTYKQHAQTLLPGHHPQAQTSMFVTDRGWWDYVQYWRAEEVDDERGHVQRIYRDDAYIENTLLPAFVSLWADVKSELQRRKLQARRLAG